MLIGVLFALLAGLMWGLIFVAPLLVDGYPPALLASGRYLAFGLIVLPLAWQARKHLAALSASDWREALALTLVGNLLYYFCLSGAILRIGSPLAAMLIGTLPVVLASGYSEQEATSTLNSPGLAGFLQKPFKLLDLSRELQRVLATSQPA